MFPRIVENLSLCTKYSVSVVPVGDENLGVMHWSVVCILSGLKQEHLMVRKF